MNRLLLFAPVLALPVALAAWFGVGDRAERSTVERGRYLVTAMGCTDCHTPWVMGPQGPEPDDTRFLSGHPADMAMPPVPELGDGPWVMVASGSNTAWAGPWGVSFTANLTPDVETGLGSWTQETFISALRTGRHMGRGREILPPMPYQAFRNLTDDDLGAIFAYLASLEPMVNRVPDPLPPATPQ